MTNQSLSFPQAISTTQDLMSEMNAKQLKESEIKQQVTSIVRDKNGGRGFFVSYLTSDLTLADNPSQGVIDALKSSIEIVSELLVKNLAMSSAMIVAHNRNNDFQSAGGSKKVYQRTSNLIQQIKSDLVEHELQKLRGTIEMGHGDYQSFIERWGYNAQQQQAIKNAIISTLNPEDKNT